MANEVCADCIDKDQSISELDLQIEELESVKSKQESLIYDLNAEVTALKDSMYNISREIEGYV